MTKQCRAGVLASLGDVSAAGSGELFSLLYDELYALASRYMRSERAGHTLQPTALVNEVYLRLGHRSDIAWQSRSHFLAVAACCIRRILLEHARKRRAVKRGGDPGRVALCDDLLTTEPGSGLDLIALDEALDELARRDRRQAGIVELRFFGGLSIEETAEVLRTTAAQVKYEWRFAKLWLRERLDGGTV